MVYVLMIMLVCFLCAIKLIISSTALKCSNYLNNEQYRHPEYNNNLAIEQENGCGFAEIMETN